MKCRDRPDRTISVIIPSYQREKSLCRLLDSLTGDLPRDAEIIVVPQGPAEFSFPHAAVRIVPVRRPNLPAARNAGISAARGNIVLFLDDDIIPCEELVRRHISLHQEFPMHAMIAGRVLDRHNRNQRDEVISFDERTAEYVCDYAKDREEVVPAACGAHLSIKRGAIETLRFDPWFIGNAQFEEVDFAFRLRRRGGTILFTPRVSIHHLLEPSGGCRSRQRLSRFYFDRFFNRSLFFAKNLGLRNVIPYIEKQKHDLEYFSRSGDRHDRTLIMFSLCGLACGMICGGMRRYIGNKWYR